VPGILCLSSAELNKIRAGVIIIGSDDSGKITITAAIDPTGTDTLSLRTGSAISQNSGATIIVDNLALRSAGTITLNDNNDIGTIAVYISASGDFLLKDINGIIIGTVDGITGIVLTNGKITLNLNGPIIHTPGSLYDFESTDFELIASGGIGTESSPLLTRITNLKITCIGGDVWIINTGALTLTNFGSGNAVTITGGSLNITTASPLTIAFDLVVGGSITLTAGNNILSPLDDLTISGNITSTLAGSTITLNAGDSILHTAGTVSIIGGGTIKATANKENDITDGNPATFTQSPGASFNSNGGNISVNSYGDAIVNSLNAGSGNVDVTAIHGMIKNAVSGVTSIIGATLNLVGNLGVGTAFASPLEVTATTALNVDSSLNNANIFIKSTGNMPVGLINAGLGNATLNSTGAITDTNTHGVNNVIAGSLNLTAPSGIDLDTAIGTLKAKTSDSDILIRETGALIIDAVDAGLGDVNISNNSGDMVLGNLIGNNVYITANSGDIIDDGDESTLVTANYAQFDAPNGNIGATSSDGDIDVDAATISARALADIGIEAQSGTFFDGVTSTSGAVVLVSNGTTYLRNITGAADVVITNTIGDLVFSGKVESTNAGVIVTSQNGSVLTNIAGPHIVGHGDTYISVPNGTISLVGIPLDVSVVGGFLVLDIGKRIGLNSGILTSPNLVPDNVLFIPSSYPSPLYPNGNVWLNGVRIWPSASAFANSQSMLLLLSKASLPDAQEFMRFLFNAIDSRKGLLFYHALSPYDVSAFTALEFGAEAYALSGYTLNLNGHDGLLPILDDIRKKRKFIKRR
ncbi:MAG: hypothetical protein NTY47_02325, partial [Candidatus Omnitrophica bacterium]|nr:hypothetical protein [Candidatus Omnitrophota bacterium]